MNNVSDEKTTNVSTQPMSNDRIEKLLNCFDTTTRDALLDFCRRISATEADIFILMARKATCFFNCLEELGLIHFNGYVTSERILDMDTNWLHDKTVIIIDDAIVSGTSINRTVDRLNQAGVKSVEVHVLSVNEKWFQPDMLTDEAGKSILNRNCNVASNEKCIDLCYEVVKAILLQPRPYDIDYPLFSRLFIRAKNLINVVNRFGWNSFDVSTVEQKANSIYSITLMPSAETVSRFERFVSCKAFSKSILKIRLYATFNDKNKKTYSVRIVPIIVFDKIDLKCIEQMFNEIVKNADKDYLSDVFISSSSKMRVVQFYYSYKLAVFWALDLPAFLGVVGNELTLEDRNLSFIFPKGVDHEVEELCQTKCPNIELTDSFDINNTDVLEYNGKITDKDYISIEARLIEPFVNLYYQKEIPCREIVLKEGKKVFDNIEYKELTQRLNKGINIGELMHTIEYANDMYDIKTRVSLFLDRSIDMGIIVPITQEKDGFIYRAYRHGEDVLFGKREEILYLYLLKEFQTELVRDLDTTSDSSDGGITHITLEKMLVIFTKLGIKSDILHPYISNFNANSRDLFDPTQNILQIKTTLKGPVALSATVDRLKKNRKKPYITTENKMIWLSNILRKRGEIQLNSQNKYTINNVDTSSITNSDLKAVQNMAIIFGQICNKNINTGINYGDDELTKISTCLTITDCIKAIAAELHIFKHHWEDAVYGVHYEINDTFLKDSKNSFYYEALNSAYMKMVAYESGEAKKIITSVSLGSRIEQNEWETWFDEVYENKSDLELSDIHEKLFVECKKLTCTLLILQNLLLQAVFINNKILSHNKQYKYFYDCESQIDAGYKILRQIEDVTDATTIIQELDSLKESITSVCEGDENSLSVNKPISIQILDRICTLIDKYVDETEGVLDDVSAILGERGHVPNMTIFTHAIAIIFRTENPDFVSRVDTHFKRCYDSALRSINNNNSDVTISLLPETNSPDLEINGNNERILWIVANGSNAAQSLAAFTMNLLYMIKIECEKFELGFCGLNVLYFGDISYQYAVKQSSSTPTEFICNSFGDYIGDMPLSLFRSEIGVIKLKMAVEQKLYEKNKFVLFVNSPTTREKTGNAYKKSDKINCLIGDSKPLTIGSYEATINMPNPEGKKLTSETKGKARIGVITILPEEAKAVIEELNMMEDNFTFGKRLYYISTVSTPVGDTCVVMTQALEQGQESASAAYNAMVQEYDPEIVFVVGIAGGLNQDADYCSVVLGHTIISYDLYRDGSGELQRRGRANNTPRLMIPVYQRLEQNIVSSPLSSYEGSPTKTIKVVESNIASGSAVIANKLSSIKEWIEDFNDKTAACEMEAYGISSAFYEGTVSQNNTRAFGVIRGISDLADNDKNKNPIYRTAAAYNAAIVLKRIIELIK